MADLQELFARLKAQASETPPPTNQMAAGSPSIWAQPQQTPGYQAPSASSPLFSPPIHTPNPIHSSNIISPVNPGSTVGSPSPEQARTNNLLNLLKFNNQPSGANAAASPLANLQNIGMPRSSSMAVSGSTHAKPLSAQDLVASLQRTPSASMISPSPIIQDGAERQQIQSNQNFLLDLLRKPNENKPVQSIESRDQDTPSLAQSSDAVINQLAMSFADSSLTQPPKPSTTISREPSPVRQFGSAASRETTPFEAPQPVKATMFKHSNPFDELHSSLPVNRPAKAGTIGEKDTELPKHNRDASGGVNGEGSGPAAKSRKTGADSTPSAPAAVEDKPQTVSEKLESVGDKVDKQVQQALAKASKPPQAAASSPPIKKEKTSDDDVESSWESAEDSANDKKAASAAVKVYNFPMKPFVTIQVKDSAEKALPIRQDDNAMVIAKLSKEFDQMDRNLVTASQSHIIYVQTATKKDNAGFRIIRQESGDHKQVFRHSGERIFSVQICNSPVAGSDSESVLGTGVNGSIFWTSLSRSGVDSFADDEVEGRGFILAPIAAGDDNTSGSPVKTRAKCSSRHPEFFAMSRGKTIHIVAPETVKSRAYCNPSTRKVNSEQYFAEHGLRISTGKAGKDFAFSEDDSVIVSLDKNGKVKFWDIAELTKRISSSPQERHDPVELREAIWTLETALQGRKSDDKVSVSSVMLLDKERPHAKGVALRYMLVGFKQNHILQLWDLGLGKAVQELRLPHNDDGDGICSISYHPKTGIIAVGHPTRNSVFFLHLSAPKYNIPTMDQAQFVRMLAAKDKTLPRPESTAIMSGLRESSFSNVGQIRSLDMLRSPVENGTERDTIDEVLFELYAMHAKGVVGVGIKRADLGWDAQSKMIEPVDAIAAGVAEVTELKPSASKDAEGKSETSSTTDTPSKKKEVKKLPEAAKAAPSPITKPVVPTSTAANGTSGGSKQIPEAPKAEASHPSNPPLMTPDSYSMAAQRIRSPKPTPAAMEGSKDLAPSADDNHVAQPANASSSFIDTDSIMKQVSQQFDALYQRLDGDKRVAEASSAAKQDAVLRLVSSTLTENVERSLHSIINSSVEEKVVPIVSTTAVAAVEKKLGELLPKELNSAIAKDVKLSLPHALQQALKDTQVQRSLADQVAAKVQSQVNTLLQQNMPHIASQAAQKMVEDLESRMQQQSKDAQAQRQQDDAKIDQLTHLVRDLSTAVQSLVTEQRTLQEQLAKAQLPATEAKPSPSTRSPISEVVDPEKEAERKEIADITALLESGDYENATIQWLQSRRQASLFDNLFVRVDPRYLLRLSPLVSLSVSAAITATFDTNIEQRLNWLSVVINEVHMNDADVVDVAPKIMDVLSQRLQAAYMNIAETRPGDGLLKKIIGLYKQASEIRRVFG